MYWFYFLVDLLTSFVHLVVKEFPGQETFECDKSGLDVSTKPQLFDEIFFKEFKFTFTFRFVTVIPQITTKEWSKTKINKASLFVFVFLAS